VEVPKQLADTDTTVLNWDQLRSVLAELSLKDRLILELDMTDALRPSELFGLRWRDFNYDECLLVLRDGLAGAKAETPNHSGSVMKEDFVVTIRLRPVFPPELLSRFPHRLGR
jgi:integrase